MKSFCYQKVIKVFLLVLSTNLLFGCAVPQRIPYVNKNAIKSISIVGIKPLQTTTIWNQAPGGFIFAGVAQGITEGVMARARGDEYFNFMQEKKKDILPPLVNHLKNRLQNAGYKVDYLPNQFSTIKDNGRTVDYSNITTDADAILAVWYGGVGYKSETYKTTYAPYMSIGAKLMDSKTKEALYFQTFRVTRTEPNIKHDVITTMPPDEKYTYDNYNHLLEHFDESILGLLDSQEKMVNRMVQDISPAKN